MKRLLILMFLVPTYGYSQEGQIRTPFNFENASLLPSGVRNVRYMDSRLDAVNKYDGRGSIVPVGNALNKSITWKDSIDGKKDLYEKAILRGTIKNYGIDENQVIGDTTGVVNIAVNAKVPIIAYGVNSKLTVAIAIPYITDDISIDSGFIANENLNKFSKNIVQGQRNSQHKAYKIQVDTLNAIENKLRDNGYKSLSASEGRRTRIGDIRLVSKYLYEKNDSNLTSFKFDLTIPTGESADPDKAVDVAAGDGQWDLGVGVATNYTFNGSFTLSGFAGVTVQLPSIYEKRIPEVEDSKISMDKDPNTRIDLGDILKLETSVTYNFWNGFSFINGLGYQYKMSDVVKGKLYSKERYNWMTRDTQQNMTTYQASLGFSTIPLFKQKKFKVPLQTNLFYTSVIDGKNVIKDDFFTVEMAMFF